MGDLLGISGAVDFLVSPQLPRVAIMGNPLGGPERGSSLSSKIHHEFIFMFMGFITLLLAAFLTEELICSF